MKILVIGVSGTMGRLVTEKLSMFNHDIVGMSRDEQKIGSMPKYANVKYCIGDIRDKSRLMSIMSQGFDSVINLSALKCVDIIEANPIEAVKTNVIGSQNLVEAAEANGKPKIVFTSTDKAVYPVNAYGQSKALAEAIYQQYDGVCSVFRYGNILGSRGSVLHTFVDHILQKKPLPITGIYMTRFWITSAQVCDILCKDIIDLTPSKPLKIIFSPSYRIYDVALAVNEAMGIPYNVKSYNIIGFRPGEKLHETLVKSSDDFTPYYKSLIRKKDYNSKDFDQYTKEEFIKIITPIIQKILSEKK